MTVVVPVRDRATQLDHLLDRLRGEGLACIVVDDASADAGATEEIAERHGAAFIGLASNVGPAGARNAGLAAVRSTVTAFVDSDCLPSPQWLEPLLGHFDDPLVAAVAPRIVATAGPAVAVRFEAAVSSLDRGAQEGAVRPGSRIPFVPSAALLVRTDVAAGPELFDAALRGGEDVDLVWRLVEAGWDVRYVPSSTVAHEGPATLKDFLVRRAFYGTTAAPLSRRHGEAVAPLHVSGWSLLVWSLLLARRPLLALTAQSASIVVLAGRLRGLVRDPRRRGNADRRPRHHALGAAGAGLVDASLGARFRRGTGLPPNPSRCGSGPRRPPRCTNGRTNNARPGRHMRCIRCRPSPSTCRRRGLRHGGLGRLRAGADLGAADPTDRLARPGVVVVCPPPRPAALAAREGLSDYPLAKRSCPA